jgi:hypothetical protein
VRTVWKYPLLIEKPTVHAIPSDDVIVHVADQGGVPTIWTIVDSDNELERRTFIVTGTGHPVTDDDASYIGTAVGPIFVWHIWELIGWEATS